MDGLVAFDDTPGGLAREFVTGEFHDAPWWTLRLSFTSPEGTLHAD